MHVVIEDSSCNKNAIKAHHVSPEIIPITSLRSETSFSKVLKTFAFQVGEKNKKNKK